MFPIVELIVWEPQHTLPSNNPKTLLTLMKTKWRLTNDNQSPHFPPAPNEERGDHGFCNVLGHKTPINNSLRKSDLA